MKRKPLFLISTLTLLGSLLYPSGVTNATISDGERLYYTPEDLLAAGEEFEAARTASCGEDYSYDCSENVLRQLSSVDRKYALYDMFRQFGLLITAVDPGNNTARIIYRDKDEMSLMWGEEPKSYDLQEFYLYWLDPSIDTTRNVVLQNYIDGIRKNTYDPTMVHVLFAGRQSADFDWVDFNKESTFQLNGEVGYSYTQNLHLYAKYRGESYGIFDLLSCYSGSYTEGTECVNVFGEDWSIINMQRARQSITEQTEQTEEQTGQTEEQEEQPEQSEEQTDQPEEGPEEPERPEQSEQPDQPEELEQQNEPEAPEEPSQPEEFEPDPVATSEAVDEPVSPESLPSTDPEPVVEEKSETKAEPESVAEIVAEKEPEPDPAPVLEPEEPTLEAKTDAETSSDEVSSLETESATENEAVGEEIKIPTTANTGEATRSMVERKEVAKDFPWWLIAATSAFIAFGIGLIIPARNKKQ